MILRWKMRVASENRALSPRMQPRAGRVIDDALAIVHYIEFCRFVLRPRDTHRIFADRSIHGGPSNTPDCLSRHQPQQRLVLASLLDSPLEGDGFELPVPGREPVRRGTGLKSRKRERTCSGTEGSNPSPSTGESGANLNSEISGIAVVA